MLPGMTINAGMGESTGPSEAGEPGLATWKLRPCNWMFKLATC